MSWFWLASAWSSWTELFFLCRLLLPDDMLENKLVFKLCFSCSFHYSFAKWILSNLVCWIAVLRSVWVLLQIIREMDRSSRVFRNGSKFKSVFNYASSAYFSYNASNASNASSVFSLQTQIKSYTVPDGPETGLLHSMYQCPVVWAKCSLRRRQSLTCSILRTPGSHFTEYSLMFHYGGTFQKVEWGSLC